MNYVGLGITIDLVRAVDHVFAEILGGIPQFLCGMLRLKRLTQACLGLETYVSTSQKNKRTRGLRKI